MKNSSKFWLTVFGILFIIFLIMIWKLILFIIVIVILGFFGFICIGGLWYGTKQCMYPRYELEAEEKIFKLSPLYWVCVGIIKFNMWIDNL